MSDRKFAGIKIPARQDVYDAAEQELSSFMLALRKKHNLTIAERVALLVEATQWTVNQAVRIEWEQSERAANSDMSDKTSKRSS